MRAHFTASPVPRGGSWTTVIDVVARIRSAGRDRRFRGPTTSTRTSGRAPCAGAQHALRPWEYRRRCAKVSAPVNACGCPRPRQARRDQPGRLVAVSCPRCSCESLARLRGARNLRRGCGWRARIRTWNKGSKDPCDTISPPANGKYRSDRRADAGMVSAFAGGSIPASSRGSPVSQSAPRRRGPRFSASGAGASESR